MTPPDLSPDSARQAPARDRRAAGPGGAEPPPRHAGARRTTRPSSPPAPSAATSCAPSASPACWSTPSPTTGSRRLAAAETEVRRVVQFGVRPDELAREIAESESALKLAADGAATRRTPALAEDIVGTLDDNDVETSPADDLALFEAAAKGLTAAEVSAALKAAFAGPGPLVFLSGARHARRRRRGRPHRLSRSPQRSRSPRPKRRARSTGPTRASAPIGKVAERKDVNDLDAVFVRFDNGVRLTVKPTKLREDQVLVAGALRRRAGEHARRPSGHHLGRRRVRRGRPAPDQRRRRRAGADRPGLRRQLRRRAGRLRCSRATTRTERLRRPSCRCWPPTWPIRAGGRRRSSG